jgi:hypothetical protein
MTGMVIIDDIRLSRLKPGKKSAMETNKLLPAANTLYCCQIILSFYVQPEGQPWCEYVQQTTNNKYKKKI